MTKTIKLRNLFDIDKFRLIPDDSPLTKSEKETLILPRNNIHEKAYSQFDVDMSLYMMKMQDSPAKTVVSSMFNRKLIFIGTDNSRNGVLGGPIISSDERLAAVVIDSSDLDISMTTGETSNIDLCFYSTYFNYIRSVVLIKRKEIRQNKDLNNLIIGYLKNIIKKSIAVPTLDPKQEIIYEALVRQFYYQFMLFFDFGHAFDVYTLKEIPEPFKDEIEELFRTSEMNRYQQFRDIFKALFDLKVVGESPNRMLGSALSKLGMSQFLYMTTVVDYLIASSILSNYPAFTLTKSLYVNRNIQEQIEKIIVGYGSTIKYNQDLVKGL
jgi:hypothetical protein